MFWHLYRKKIMSYVLVYTPGQTATIIQQILTADGYRADGYSFAGSGPNGFPVIARIVFPNLTLAAGYPAAMTKLDTGLYYSKFILPTGSSAVGTYLVDGYWYNPTTLKLQQMVAEVVVTAPFGQYSVTPG
jgi:hypothetical protein